MEIRHYEPGDEAAQVDIYNAAVALLPAFKPAKVEEVARRYQTTDPDPTTKLYAVQDGKVIGYALYSLHGQISYPWGADQSREPLLNAVLEALRARGTPQAWVAYRADWLVVQQFFQAHGFAPVREMINYIADVHQLPRDLPAPGQTIAPLERSVIPRVIQLGRELFGGIDAAQLEHFFWDNPHFDPAWAFCLHGPQRQPLGVGLAVVRPSFANPAQIDSAMPCFRLGALGTESQRHKRVNGLVSFLFSQESPGKVMLSEAARRLEAAGLTHAAAEAPSDHPGLCAFYQKFFTRQGSFPILARPF
jgi:hypothetical protein